VRSRERMEREVEDQPAERKDARRQKKTDYCCKDLGGDRIESRCEDRGRRKGGLVGGRIVEAKKDFNPKMLDQFHKVEGRRRTTSLVRLTE